ncbi:soluble guanylate cyclase-like protein [Euroglyphus maynei]|uniref:Soluble guanylate cyclase-like protein n=1 Tax=Euroglyphus maynei TaxID=6958 RepID=A0A1Y3B293_EURMA|nr:soluble guanylate cyclase-like protein [Euroglyphus maynei]
MYGLLIENIIQYIQDNFGVDKWNEIRRLAQIEETSFHTHTVYPDVYTKNIIDKACKILRITEKQLLLGIGESFVTFIGRYGYDVVLSALGMCSIVVFLCTKNQMKINVMNFNEIFIYKHVNVLMY